MVPRREEGPSAVRLSRTQTMEPRSWKCPFCGHLSVIRDPDTHTSWTYLTIDNKDGPRALYSEFVVCPNTECNRFTLKLALFAAGRDEVGRRIPICEKIIGQWHLIPQSDARVLPDYIPRPIVEDYNEACAIRDLSPKASATLARRCIQGMIRDFHKVSKSHLKDEIEAIKDEVDDETWTAIEAVRHVGNIGAHMEKDINVIIDVDPQEAGLLLRLIETLVDEWYVARYERRKRMNGLRELGASKANNKQKGSRQDSSAVSPK